MITRMIVKVTAWMEVTKYVYGVTLMITMQTHNF